jgi:hypothetical protein
MERRMTDREYDAQADGIGSYYAAIADKKAKGKLDDWEKPLTAAQYRESVKAPKKSKYRNQKTVVDGITFDSKREAAYYGELKQREKAGEVYEVQLQPAFKFVHNGVLIGTYRGDFLFYDAIAKRTRLVDVKGFATREFQKNRRLMRAFHKIEVEVVK